VRDGKSLNPEERLGQVTITYLAEGGDGQAAAQLSRHLDNVHCVSIAGDGDLWGSLGRPQPSALTAAQAPQAISKGVQRRQVGFGSYRDALGAYLEAHHDGGRPANPLRVADQLSDPSVGSSRIVPIDARVGAAQKP